MEMHGSSISYSTCLGVSVEATANMSISRLLDHLRCRNLRYVRASGLERQHTSLRQAGQRHSVPSSNHLVPVNVENFIENPFPQLLKHIKTHPTFVAHEEIWCCVSSQGALRVGEVEHQM